MLDGQVYNAAAPGLLDELQKTKMKVWVYNSLRPDSGPEKERILRSIIPDCGLNPIINQPFRCDYGANIKIGDNFFANFNLTILDEARVTIGNDVFIGPNVSMYTACHSTDPVERKTRQEWAKPISIGNDVWIGGSVVILPGVKIGNNCTIGAGSVVVKDIPDNSVAVGNPCKVIKKTAGK